MQRLPDPYRELGVARGASGAQIKAAHRALAKRFHPDAVEGDTVRFLAIQEAYLLLSNPIRRRDWDAAHAPGPVRADGTFRGPRSRAAQGHWTREDPSTGTRRTRGGAKGANLRGAGGPGSAGSTGPTDARAGTGAKGAGGPADGAAGRPSGGSRSGRRPSGGSRPPTDAGAEDVRRPADAWSPSGRDAASRSYTWSAEGVPWWEDFTPRGARDAGKRRSSRAPGDAAKGRSARPARGHRPTDADDGARPGPSEGPPPSGSPADTPDAPHNEFDVYSRSSGAAWSFAARRYFRKGDKDLPRGGSFVYRGTQVVTGAQARRVTEDEARQREADDAAADQLFRARQASAPSPRQAFTHEPPVSPATPQGPTRGRPSPVPRPQMRVDAAPPPDDGSRTDGAPISADAAGFRDRVGSPLGAVAAVGAIAAVLVTLPILALTLGGDRLDLPVLAAILVLAAATGAVAAAAWDRSRGRLRT